jgi:hypothetical protein
MDRPEPKERIIRFGYGIRRNSMRRIIIRREYKEKYAPVSTLSLLEGAKREFDEEMRLLRLFKEKVEVESGQSLGTVIDADGRQI